MLLESEYQEYLALQIIAQSVSPVGSGYLSREMKKVDLCISEATAGRILNRLDHGGYTKKVGFQGRVLTPEGVERFKELEGRKTRLDQGEEFFSVLHKQTKERLIDILVARRAIEKELARLAAINATQDEILEMWAIQRSQFEHASRSDATAEQDVLFHRSIAKAAKNPVLITAIEMIRQDGQLTPIFEYIRKTVHSVISYDHAQIILAIENHDPDQAEQAMVRHIENLISDVNRYWDEVEKNDEAEKT
jgi:GntR family transcriptional repressor for pyruvate dehydrogenase complex